MRYLVKRVDIVECITMYKDMSYSHIVVCTFHVLSLDIHKKEIETVAKWTWLLGREGNKNPSNPIACYQRSF